jgi:pilus assembly protein CpaF
VSTNVPAAAGGPARAADLLEQVRAGLAQRGAPPTAAHVAGLVRAQGRVLGDEGILDLVDALGRESVGAGPLDALLQQPGVTDVLVNGPDRVFVDGGDGLRAAPIGFPDDDAVRRLAQRLAASGGRRLDDASPFVDVRLRDGTRLHAALAPVARPGTLLSLRVPARRVFTLDALTEAGTVSPSVARVLAGLVAARRAFLVTGGTGTGKTTLLAALLSRVAPSERLVLVEDSAELRPAHPHVVALEARPPNVEGAGEITLRDLVRQALRMRPDRLVVGEVRGAEVVDLLGALNTGHDGGCSTLHANSPADVPARLEALGVTVGLSREAVHSQVAAALHVVVHLVRGPGGVRRVGEVAVLSVGRDGRVSSMPALTHGPGGAATPGPGADRLAELLERVSP